MPPQEHEILSQFLTQLTSAPTPQRDDQADRLIREAFAQHPDAPYLVVQRALLLEQALNAAKAQVSQLQRQIQTQQSPGRSDFLGENPWTQAMNAGPTPSNAPGTRQYSAPAQPASSPVGAPLSGASSFLGNLATTAAGVVAGSFLFQSIENLMGHHQSGGGWLSGNSQMGGPLTEETTINNYYDSPRDDQVADNDAFLASDDSDYTADDSDSNWV